MTGRALWSAFLLCVCVRGWPQAPDPTLRQLNERVYGAADGVPGDIDTMAQTSDGTLWIGGRAGLTRFDGARFVPYPGSTDEPLHSTNIAGLLAAPDGGLWIGFRPGGVSYLKDGHITHYGEAEGLPSGTVQQLAFDRDGSLWAAARSGLAHFDGKRWETLPGEPELARPYGVLVDRAGTLWVAGANGLFARAAGDKVFRVVDTRTYSDPNGGLLALAPDGKVWAVADNELVWIQQPGAAGAAGGGITLRGISSPLLFDEVGNLWAAADLRGRLRRVASQDLSRAAQNAHADISNPEYVTALLEDREHNIWVGTLFDLHRFSRSNVVGNIAPPCPRSVYNPVFVAGDAATLYIACGEVPESHLDEIRAGVVVSHQATPAFSVAYRDREGTFWFGGSNGLSHLDAGRIVTTPLPARMQGSYILALMRDSAGALWVAMNRGGVFRVVDGEWSEYGNLAALPRGIVYAETADDDGTLWFGYANNRVARVKGAVVQVFDATQGLELGNVLTIMARDAEVWVGGELGLARFNGTRFEPIQRTGETPFRGVSGIVKARNGDFWLNGFGGITHVTRQQIERAVRDPTFRLQFEVFDRLDGVPGIPVQLQSQPSALETTDGRLWFMMRGGVVSIDPTQLVRNTLPPPVTIRSLASGSKHFARSSNLQLPIQTTDLQIEYSAGSLTVPERVNFRYKLEGSDRDWQEVGTRREARYTNLGPGRYTFRVTAANNDGVWNNTGAALGFTILPAFYQTGWFYALCALAGVAALGALYRVRMHQVAAQVRGRLEARLAERERIARELHDTLLQGVQGLIWRFQAATDRIAPGEPARQLMEESLDRADQMLAESRDKVKDLRPTADNVIDLAQALATEGERFSQLHPAQFRVNVQGTARELHPIVREEGFLIGREALGNAFQHAGAQDIEAEVAYGDRGLHVRIRDDGKGIGAAVLSAGGRPGHFGLIGMRERALKLGGQLEVWSKPGAGTEIDLRVPADVAYRSTRPAARRIFRRFQH